MLRGVSASSVPATGTVVFDNRICKFLPSQRTASGDMMTRRVRPTRDQVLAGLAGPFPAQKDIESKRAMPYSGHGSQSHALQLHDEQVTQEHFPPPPGGGPIEANVQSVYPDYRETFRRLRAAAPLKLAAP